MKLGIIPENLIERLALAWGAVPTPLLETMIAMLLSRTIMVGTKLGIFEALASKGLSADEIAKCCKTHLSATRKLLNALVGAGYLCIRKEQYSLTPVARKWLLKDSRQSLYDNMLFRFMEWEIIKDYEEFLRSGKSLDIHETLFEDEKWELYQRGMRSLASTSASEVVERTPIPKWARNMLDIGGSHGYYSVALCRRHPHLRAVILELPEAVKHAAPILAKEGMGDRVVHRVGNALTNDLGTAAWDVVFIAQVIHHFDEATNRELVRRIANALRPGGVFIIQEVIRPLSPKEAGQPGALLDLYFSLTSKAGTWSFEEMIDWQREAGLLPCKPIRFRSVPGVGQQTAIKTIR